MSTKTTLLLLGMLIFFVSINIQAQAIDATKELIAIKNISKNNLTFAIKYTDSILNYNFKNKDTVFLKYANLVFQSHKFEKALDLYKKIEQKALTNKNDNYLLASYLGIAQVNSFLKNQDDAIAYAHKALKLAKKIKDLDHQAEALNIFAYISSTVEDYKQAIFYLNQYIKIQNNSKKLGSAYNNLSICYLRLNQLDSARLFLTKSLPIFIKLKEKERIAMIYNNMGNIDKKLKNYPIAISNYKKAIIINEELATNSTSAYINLGEIYHEQAHYEQANKYYQKGLKTSTKTKDSDKQAIIYHRLLKIALDQSNSKNAKLYLVKRDSLDKIIATNKTKDKAKLIKTQFQQRLEKGKLNQELILNKKNNIIFYTLAGLLLFVGLFFLQKYRNRQLKLKQDKLVLEQKVLRSQMNPHFIFNALTSIQKNLLEEDLLKSSTSLARFAKLIRQNFEFTNKALINLDEDLEALKNYIETQQLRFEDKFDYQINIQKGLDLSYIEIPPMLLQPFVENAIEHGFKRKDEKGILIINVLKKDNLFTFEIVDNGVGYTENNSKTTREHAIDIFLNRLKLRGFSEAKSFKITKGENDGEGTKISFSLKL